MARRHHLAAAAIAVTLGCAAVPRPAHALFGAGDVVFDPSVFGQVVQQAKNGLQQLQQLEQNGQILTNQLMQLRTFYSAFAHLTDISQLASILRTPTVMNPLPQITQLEGMLSGNGFTGQLGSLVQQFVNQNRAYTPTGTDWQAQEMLRTANVTASQMALGNQLYSSAAERIQGLSELEGRLATSSDRTKETLDLIARRQCRKMGWPGAAIAGTVTDGPGRRATTNNSGRPRRPAGFRSAGGRRPISSAPRCSGRSDLIDGQ